MNDSEKITVLKDLINGEWVDCDKVQEALSIDFSTGLKMFDFSRTAEWNPYPLNGQKITIKFRLKTPKNTIKEFAERLKVYKRKPEFPWDDWFVTESDIDGLVKIMGGDD